MEWDQLKYRIPVALKLALELARVRLVPPSAVRWPTASTSATVLACMELGLGSRRLVAWKRTASYAQTNSPLDLPNPLNPPRDSLTVLEPSQYRHDVPQ